jgi:hypothetical protein
MKRLEKQRAKAERRVQKKDTDPQVSDEEELVVLTEPLRLEEFDIVSELEPLS